MNKLFKYILISVSVIILAWVLPDMYHFVTTKKTHYPFILYSSLKGDFLIQEFDNKDFIYKDTKGNSYSSKQVDSLVPTFYYRQLVTENRLPDSIMGVSVSAQLIRKTNFFFRHSPRDINAPTVALYPLLESRPKRIDLSMPDDIVRFTNRGVEFIDIETNSVKRDKSELFQKVFEQKGVEFPIKKITGDPNARKEYDEGYFFTDNKNQLFHLKQMVGQPYLRHIEIEPSIEIKELFITEYPNRLTFAFIVDTNSKFYVLKAPNYELVKTDIPAFNPNTDAMMIMGNMFDWNVKISNNQSIINYALDAKDFSLLNSYSTPLQTTKWETVAGYIFPFELRFSSYLNKYFKPRIEAFSLYAIFVNILFLVVFIALKRKRMKAKSLVISSLCIAMFGVFAFIPLIVYESL